MQKLLNEALKKIKPSKSELESEKKFIEKMIKKIDSIKGKHVETLLCGSIARNTHLKGDRDIDLFVLFPQSLKRKEFEEEGLRIAKTVFKGHKFEKLFSEHPYLRAEIEGFEIEIVPAYKIEKPDERLSAVDRSPLHSNYLNKKLSEKQKDEIRLLRQFLKGIKAYGADLKTESFPGYVTELLVLNYGNFLNTLKAVSEWRKGTAIDIENYYSNKEEMRKKFSGTHLIIVDPTDKNRNVAAAPSLEQFDKFIAASKAFLNSPSQHFFFGKTIVPWKKSKVKALLKKKEVIGIEMVFPKAIADIVWGQTKRLRKKIESQLELNEFKIFRAKEWSNERDLIAIFIDLENSRIQRIAKHIGPEITDFENSKKFLEANKKSLVAGPRIEKGRWVIEKKRKHWDAIAFLKEFLKKEKSIAKTDIKKALKTAKVLDENGILKLYSRDKEFAQFLTQFLKGKEEFLEY